MTTQLDILSLTSAEFAGDASLMGISEHAAIKRYRILFRTGSCDAFDLQLPSLEKIKQDGSTTKFILRHDDGLETESVIIPIRSSSGRLRNTLCVSSQVGCAMGCEFCETAQMGLMKNLGVSDIVAQWFVARHQRDTAIDNIVFMGMGEPMDNIDVVIQAIRVLTDRNGCAIPPANISVSTVGRTAGIRELAAFAKRPGFRQLKLAVSVNAPNDAIRSKLMPINRAEPMDRLMDAMKAWTDHGPRVFIEYVLIPEVNDQLAHADELAAYLADLPCKVNVIPYNPRRNSPWPAPDDASVDAFTARLHARGLFVTRRQTHGRSAMAACGQLGNQGIRNRKFVSISPDNTLTST